MMKEMEMKNCFDEELALEVDKYGTNEDIEILAIMYGLDISYKLAVSEYKGMERKEIANYVSLYFRRMW